MKRHALYPGSFNPIHEGHLDVIEKALKMYTKVFISRGINPEKERPQQSLEDIANLIYSKFNGHALEQKDETFIVHISTQRIIIQEYKELLVDHLFDLKSKEIDCIIKGIRDTNDFLYEQKMQYWNEDLGIVIPTVYIISDRKLVHMSSSAIRSLEKFK